MSSRAWFVLLLVAPPLWGLAFLVGLALLLAWLSAGWPYN